VRLLVDENIPKAAVEVLCAAGHDALWIRTYAPGTADKDVLRLAAHEERVVVTLDKDFRHIGVDDVSSDRYGVILFRIHPAVPAKILPILSKTLALDLPWFKHLSIVSETAVQMIPLRGR
jgi:predicted nuclease of predicted toxin-antitoxin system